MARKIRTHLSYANVMATAAVFVALGGSSYAAISITGKNVKNSSLTGMDLKDSSITGKDVEDGALRARDFKPGELPKGDKGDKGEPGTNASVNGVAAGGDLTGAYPNPRLAAGAVTGTDVAGDTLTGEHVDEATLGQVPDAATLDGLGPETFERPATATASFGGLQGQELIRVGGLHVIAYCFNGHPNAPNGAGVSVSNIVSGSASRIWMSRSQSTARYGEITNTAFLGATPEALTSASPEVWVYQGIDQEGRLFRVTATSRYEAGTCHFTAWGSAQA
jgi:hypothetical protein